MLFNPNNTTAPAENTPNVLDIPSRKVVQSWSVSSNSCVSLIAFSNHFMTEE